MVQRNKKSGVEAEMKDASPISQDLGRDAVEAISESLRRLLADVFALYFKTKNFHWHISGPHFRDYHLLLDEQAAELYAITDDLAERARKIGGTTLRSIGDITRHQTIKDNDDEFVAPRDMLIELSADNRHLSQSLRDAHELCDEHEDIATASMIEVWVDQAERRVWFLSGTVRDR
jgi:starvation-inducible DNA-binding protein